MGLVRGQLSVARRPSSVVRRALTSMPTGFSGFSPMDFRHFSARSINSSGPSTLNQWVVGGRVARGPVVRWSRGWPAEVLPVNHLLERVYEAIGRPLVRWPTY